MECELCHRKFTSKQTLDYHLTHGVCTKQNQNKTCPYCGFIFTAHSALLNHVSHNVCGGVKKPKPVLKLKTCPSKNPL